MTLHHYTSALPPSYGSKLALFEGELCPVIRLTISLGAHVYMPCIRYSFKNKAPALLSGTFMVYEILPIGVRERHHDVKARMICSCLVGVELQRLGERTDEEMICCFGACGSGM